MGSQQQNIVMLPYMAQGHLIPFLALANLIEQHHPHLAITIVNTPINIRNLRPSLPPGSKIRLHTLPFSSSDHGLPPDSENTDSLPRALITRLMEASDTLRPDFERFLATVSRPLAIVSDVFFGWAAASAAAIGAFHAAFSTCGAYGTAAYFSLWLHLPHLAAGEDLESEFGVPGFPEGFRLKMSQIPYYMRTADGSDPNSVIFRKQIRGSMGTNGGMLCNTVAELETMGLGVLAGISGLRIWTIGPLLPLEVGTPYRRAGKKPGIDPEACIRWLDSQPSASVIYVSFGSQNAISASQMMQLATGLESSGKPFIWVIRPPIGFGLNDDFDDNWLPEGFESRKNGILVKQWAPQLEILSHKSTGAFLSHCGWNSVLESLSRGVPIIGWPLSAEQFYNSKMLEEELGVGVELARGAEEEIGSGDMERVIGLVMGNEGMKERAVRCREMIRDAMKDGGDERGSSIVALQEFIETAFRLASGDGM